MSRHYTQFERTRMDVQTLLASDPTYWRAFETIVESGEVDR